jgi:hypothetical protein
MALSAHLVAALAPISSAMREQGHDPHPWTSVDDDGLYSNACISCGATVRARVIAELVYDGATAKPCTKGEQR